jgi:hypothetical protein
MPVAVCTDTTAVISIEFTQFELRFLQLSTGFPHRFPGAASGSFTHSVDRLFGNTWPPYATLSWMTDASSVKKFFIPPSDRGLRRSTKSKLPSKRTLNRHKIPGHTNYARSGRQPISNTGLRFSREMATIGPFQIVHSLCVIDTNFTILRHFLLKLWCNEILR